jgi:hypothetical protein
MSVHFLEYELEADSGGSISVLEIDESANPCLREPATIILAAPVLNICPRIPRSIVEEAKKGFTKTFESMMGSPPIGMLLKMKSPVCGDIMTCPSADRLKCTTKNVRPSDKPMIGKFPVCWELWVGDIRGPNRYAVEARAIANVIVNAWKEDRRAIIVIA